MPRRGFANTACMHTDEMPYVALDLAFGKHLPKAGSIRLQDTGVAQKESDSPFSLFHARQASMAAVSF